MEPDTAAIRAANDQIIHLLRPISLQSLLRHVSLAVSDAQHKGVTRSPLRSPIRQSLHILALGLDVCQRDGRGCSRDEWQRIEAEVNVLYELYTRAHLGKLPDEGVAWLLAFSHYFETVPLPRPEQTIARIEWLRQYDSDIDSAFGIAPSQARPLLLGIRDFMEQRAWHSRPSQRGFRETLARITSARSLPWRLQTEAFAEELQRLYNMRLCFQFAFISRGDATRIGGDGLVRLLDRSSVEVPHRAG